jgi:hypothetical protein
VNLRHLVVEFLECIAEFSAKVIQPGTDSPNDAEE